MVHQLVHFCGLILIWIFHHPAQLLSQCCQIPSAQSESAESGARKIQVNPTQVQGTMNPHVLVGMRKQHRLHILLVHCTLHYVSRHTDNGPIYKCNGLTGTNSTVRWRQSYLNPQRLRARSDSIVKCRLGSQSRLHLIRTKEMERSQKTRKKLNGITLTRGGGTSSSPPTARCNSSTFDPAPPSPVPSPFESGLISTLIFFFVSSSENHHVSILPIQVHLFTHRLIAS